MPMSRYQSNNIIIGLTIIAVQLVLMPFYGFTIWGVIGTACGFILLFAKEPK